jgi:hypothetical protein
VLGGDDPVVAGYWMHGLYRAQTIVLFAFFSAIFLALIVVSVAGRWWGVFLFLVPMIAGLYWIANWWLRCVSYRVDLRERTLRWWAPLRSGEIQLDQLRAVVPSRHGFHTADLVSVHGGRVPVLIRRGFAAFVAEVQAAAPHVTVRLNRYSRMVDRLPGSSGFHRSAAGGG